MYLEITGCTDAGLVRNRNEDAILCDEELCLAIIADGMGGHNAGDQASSTAVCEISSDLKKKLPAVNPGRIYKNTGLRFGSILVGDAISLANAVVHDQSLSNNEYRGMGTTVVVALFYDDRFTVAHVGDSRCYRLRESMLTQITRDHSYAREMMDRCDLPAEQASELPTGNAITRAVGVADYVRPDMYEDTVEAGDVFVICTDGLTNLLDDTLILDIVVNNSGDLGLAASELVSAANERGGNDNISVILVRPRI